MVIKLPIAPERLEKRSMFQKITGADSAENAFARAKNLVITGEFSQSVIENICDDCNIDIPVVFHQRWIELFREIIYYLLEDGVVDATEKEFAREYISTFHLDKSEVDGAIQRAGRDIYIEKLIRMVGPDGLSSSQHTELDRFANQIGLKDVKSAYNETVGHVLKAHIQDVLLDNLLTPNEMENFTILCNRLRVDPTFDPVIEQQLSTAKARWDLLSKPLMPILASDIRLGKNEIAYLDESGEWYETRKVNTGGASIDRYRLIHSGRIILTNTRLLLIAQSTGSNKALKWSSLLAVQLGAGNETELVKERGKSPIIKFFDLDDSPSDGPLIVRRLFQDSM